MKIFVLLNINNDNIATNIKIPDICSILIKLMYLLINCKNKFVKAKIYFVSRNDNKKRLLITKIDKYLILFLQDLFIVKL